jgi:integrase
MSAGRWANVRSLLRAALDLVKQELPAVRRKPMSPVWANLFGRLSKASRIRVSRLLRFFSELSVEPDAVAPDHFEQFRQMLEGDALIRKPNQVWREAIGVWNSSRHKISGWPSIEIVAASRRDTFSLPWSAFPESFKADADAYLARISGSDLLDDLPFRPVRPGTRQTREYQSRAAASALVRRGRAPETIRSLSDLVELGAFKEILRFFMTRRGNKTSAGIEHLANFLKSVARHWVKVDTATLQKMSDTIKNHISMPNSGMTPKNRERLRPFDDEENVYALLNLPAHLMREAVSGRHSKIRSAILAQLAVAIELELVRPLRISNLAALELYRHILQRTNGSWYITIPEDEVKNRIDLEHDLPVEASTLLERYLKDFRPLLAKPGNAALFPGDLGCKAKNTLGGQLTKIIHAYTGLKMHPHLFRHFGSCEYLKEHPGEYPVISHVLGHKSLNTAAKSYTGMESAAAVRHFGKTIIKKLQELPSRGNDAHRAWRRKKPKSDPKGGKN